MKDDKKTKKSKKPKFLSVPWFLIEDTTKDKLYENLSLHAKFLYSLCLGRKFSSEQDKNKWTDEQGNIYVIYTIQELMEKLKCSKEKVNKTLKELKEIKLIKVKRQGLNKPNLIYVNNIAKLFEDKEKQLEKPENTRTPILKDSRSLPNRIQEANQIGASNISISNINISKRDFREKEKKNVVSCHVMSGQKKKRIPRLSINSIKGNYLHTETKKISASIQHTTSNAFAEQKAQKSIKYDYNIYLKILQDNINYNNLVDIGYQEIKLVDDCINIMLDVICTEDPYIKIDRESKPREIVRSMYLKIEQGDILYVIDRFREAKKKITNKANFLKTLLYYSKLESNAHYENLYRSSSFDFKGNFDNNDLDEEDEKS